MKSFSLEFDEDEANWMKARFEVETDAELRTALEKFIREMVILRQCPVREEEDNGQFA